MKTLYAAGAVAIAAALYAGSATAQQSVAPRGRWCAVDSEIGDADSCTYSSLEQCLAAFNQTSGICYPLMTDETVHAAPAPRRSRTHHS